LLGGLDQPVEPARTAHSIFMVPALRKGSMNFATLFQE